MPANDKRIARHVTDVLVHDDRIEASRAEDAVSRAVAKSPALAADALELYRAARRILRIDSVPPAGHDVVHSPVKPDRAPPPKRGTLKDTPAAKKTR